MSTTGNQTRTKYPNKVCEKWRSQFNFFYNSVNNIKFAIDEGYQFKVLK